MITLNKQDYESVIVERLDELKKLDKPCALTIKTIEHIEKMLNSNAVIFNAPGTMPDFPSYRIKKRSEQC